MTVLKSVTQPDRAQREAQTVGKAVVRAAAALGFGNRRTPASSGCPRPRSRA